LQVLRQHSQMLCRDVRRFGVAHVFPDKTLVKVARNPIGVQAAPIAASSHPLRNHSRRRAVFLWLTNYYPFCAAGIILDKSPDIQGGS
jgi:hypothetical protein